MVGSDEPKVLVASQNLNLRSMEGGLNLSSIEPGDPSVVVVCTALVGHINVVNVCVVVAFVLVMDIVDLI